MSGELRPVDVDGDVSGVDLGSEPLRVADSWRQIDGRVRCWGAHRERFVASVTGGRTGGTTDAAGIPTDALDRPGDHHGSPADATGITTGTTGIPIGGEGRGRRPRPSASGTRSPWAAVEVEAFLDAAVRVVPATGEWFPRVRLVGEDLLLDVRPGPPRSETAVVAIRAPGDPRTQPRVKGPDLARCGRLIDEARSHGADEVLLREESGVVLEAGYAAVVWWDGDDLCVPAPHLPVLPSITRAAVEDLARTRGVRVRPVEAHLTDLDGRETWLLNAYQGLRLVTGWITTSDPDHSLTPGNPQAPHDRKSPRDPSVPPPHDDSPPRDPSNPPPHDDPPARDPKNPPPQDDPPPRRPLVQRAALAPGGPITPGPGDRAPSWRAALDADVTPAPRQ